MRVSISPFEKREYSANSRTGGLSTSVKSVRANLMVSVCVAITGIGAPMGLSFILKELVGATSLQAFAAGASLSATSLGTTFTILSTTNLISTRLGTVTTSAAMLDDVVGLVMVQIISNLGGGASSFNALTVIRPVFVSIGFAVGLFLLCAFIVGPTFKRVLSAKPKVPTFMRGMQFAFLYQTVLLVGLVAGATYAGTSSLFAAYLAGVIVTWFDGMIAQSKMSATASSATPPTDSTLTDGSQDNGGSRPSGQSQVSNVSSTNAQYDETPTGEKVYEKYYKQPVSRILTPLFFVSLSAAPCTFTILMQKTGIDWVCNPHHRDVQRKCSVAWHHLCSPDDVWQIDHWYLACPFLIASSLDLRQWTEKTVFSNSSLLHAYGS